MRRSETIKCIRVTIPTVCLFILTILFLIMYVEISGTEANYTKGKTEKKLKYILLHTGDPFYGSAQGRTPFTYHNCSDDLCFFTTNKSLLGDITKFDALIFHGPDIPYIKHKPPTKRSEKQVYIFWSIEPPQRRPKIHPVYNNNFFNWTCTYKLDSDLVLSYLLVKDNEGKIIGPSPMMNWIEDDKMLPINNTLKYRLNRKYKTAAWVVSHCRTNGRREIFVDLFQKELKEYNLTLDIFGQCGEACKNCWDIIDSDYHFYLSFENSFSKDYVTEKVLNPLKHYTVPIVFGTSNYSRFMPRSAYLDALELGAKNLAKEINDIIENRQPRYYNFFRWHNHYSYHDPLLDPATHHVCELCAALHYGLPTRTKVDFTRWWYGKKLPRLLTRNCNGRECFF